MQTETTQPDAPAAATDELAALRQKMTLLVDRCEQLKSDSIENRRTARKLKEILTESRAENVQVHHDIDECLRRAGTAEQRLPDLLHEIGELMGRECFLIAQND
jgi:chromosome segregation ATPase